MLISIIQRGSGAQSLSKRLSLDPGNITVTELPFGRAISFFPTYGQDAAEYTLLLEVANERLTHDGPYLGSGHPLQAFVHARAYTTSSLTSVAIGKVFAKVMEQEMPATQYEILVAAVDTRIDNATLESWFVPLGYAVEIHQATAEEGVTARGFSRCKDVNLTCKLPLSMVLKHLQTLLCALDGDHVYWIGREATLAISNSATHWLEGHPERDAIQSALLVMPYCASRLSRSNLVEQQDEFAPPPKRNLYRIASEMDEIYHVILSHVHQLNCSSALVVMPENERLTSLLAAQEHIQKLLLIDLQMEYLQEIALALNQSNLPVESKRKISLIPASPLYQNDQFKEFDAIILEGTLDKLPTHQWPAMEATFIRHCKPKLIVVVQLMGKEFKNWVGALGKEYLLDTDVIIPKVPEPVKGPPLGIAVFTLKENH